MNEMKSFVVITLMPSMFFEFASTGVVGEAFKSKRANIEYVNPRDFATDKHKSVDDTPYGGGAGMVLKPEPISAAIDQAKKILPSALVYYLSPEGKIFDNKSAQDLSQKDEMILLCGRYLGIDQRIIDEKVDAFISLGNYITSGGEIPAMLVIDAVMRFEPGVLGNGDSQIEESFVKEKLAPPCYTRPPSYNDKKVPEVLLSGNHQKIEDWRNEQADIRTSKWKKLNR